MERWIKAVFRRGAFEPLEPVNLPEGTRVRLTIVPIETEIHDDIRDKITAGEGVLPDNTARGSDATSNEVS